MAPKGKKSFKKGKGKKSFFRKKNQISGGPLKTGYKGSGVFSKFNGVDPFPPSQVVKMKYCETIVCTSGTSGIYGTEKAFRLNSIYDPNYTGAGHQPYGHDELATLYNKYKVTGVLIDLEWTSPTSGGVICSAVIRQANDSYTTTGKATDSVNEKPMAHTETLNQYGKGKMRWVQYMPMHEIIGVTKEQFRTNINDTYCAQFGQNPESPLLLLNACSVGSGTGDSVSCRVNLTYYVQVFDRLVQTQS